MRARHRIPILGVSLCLVASAALAEDPYAQYRIPEHRWLSWSATLNAGGDRALYDTQYGFQSLERRGSGYASSSLYGGFDSDRRSRAYGLSLFLSGGRQTSDEGNDGFAEGHGRSANAFERASAFYALSHYPWQAPLGFSLAANANIRPEQRWSSEDEVRTYRSNFYPPLRIHSTASSTSGSYDANATLSASVGWGRVRDATPVYQVQVLEQRLHETGAIHGALSPHARERLAALYTVESDLSFAHQRPTKYFWRELEQLLNDDGVLGPGGLDAYTVQRLLEPVALVTRSFARVRGYSVGPLVKMAKGWAHLSSESHRLDLGFVGDSLYDTLYSAQQPRTKVDTHSEGVSSGLFVEYHRPFGMQWQADAFSSALVSDGAKTVSFSSALSAAWAIADRWQWNGILRHDASAPGQPGDRKVDHWTFNAVTSLNYFFEDSWAFQVGYQHQQAHTSWNFYRTDTYTLGVSYQFAGWLDAPGLFAPMRLQPPSQ